jgi:hypothetical protein
MHPLLESGFGQGQIFEKGEIKWQEHGEIFTGSLPKGRPPRDPSG